MQLPLTAFYVVPAPVTGQPRFAPGALARLAGDRSGELLYAENDTCTETHITSTLTVEALG